MSKQQKAITSFFTQKSGPTTNKRKGAPASEDAEGTGEETSQNKKSRTSSSSSASSSSKSFTLGSASSSAKPLPAEVEQLRQHLREPSWREELDAEFRKPYFTKLAKFLQSEKRNGKTIFPPEHLIFHSLDTCPFDALKVVILGQDPYHDNGQAMGMSFSVPFGVTPPPSLRNMFKELAQDPAVPDFKENPKHGNLDKWARQGVLLLNVVLTVEAHKANAHKGKGWEQFTDAIIRLINAHKQGVVFLLWGKPAQTKMSLINTAKHHVLTTVHPSPLSANKGFFGCRHFSRCNELLREQGQDPIDWTLDPEEVEKENQRKWEAEKEKRSTEQQQQQQQKEGEVEKNEGEDEKEGKKGKDKEEEEEEQAEEEVKAKGKEKEEEAENSNE
ncbi:Uracil-DNA glycosylase [Balamuthia mandrillaris]